MSSKERILSLFMAWLGLLVFAIDNTAHAMRSAMSENPSYTISSIEMLEDPSFELDIDAIQASHMNWEPVTRRNREIRVGQTTSSWWFRFKLPRVSGESESMYLEVEDAMLDRVRFYHLPGHETPIYLGDELAYHHRLINLPTYAVPVDLDEYEGEWVYLNVACLDSINFSIELKSIEQVLEQTLMNKLYIGAYLGLLIGMVVYNFFIFLSVRDSSYIYYILFELSLGYHLISVFGLGFQYLWPDSPWLQNVSPQWSLILSGVFVIQFMRRFIRLKEHYEILDRIAVMVIAGITSGFIIVQFVDRYIGWYIIQAGFAMATLGGTSIVFYAYFTGIRAARFIIVGWVGVFIAATLNIISHAGYLFESNTTSLSIIVVSAFEMVLFSMALSDRIRILEAEKRTTEAVARLRERNARNKGAINERIKNISEFAAISHEFRTPLTLILGPITQLYQTADAAMKLKLDLIQRNAMRLQQYVDQILEISRTQVGLQVESPVGIAADCTAAQIMEKEIYRDVEVDTEALPKILIVDDDEDMLNYLQSCLRANVNCVPIKNVEQVMPAIEQHNPVLVLSDIMMKPVSGLELCRQLKSNVATDHIPVVLLTAHNASELKLKSLADGADEVMTKPFSAQELNLRIKNIIGHRENIKNRFSLVDIDKDDSAIGSKEREFVHRIRLFVEREIDNAHYDYQGLASDLNLTVRSTQNKVKALTGETPNGFIQLVRLEAAEKILREPKVSVKQVAYSVGFENPAYFSRVFKKRFGRTPSDYQEFVSKTTGVLHSND